MTKREKLTAGRVRDFDCPANKAQAFKWDSDAPGFAVRATAGAKAFIFQGRFKGKTIRLTIGDVKTWGIDAAREKARSLQIIIDGGRDPREVRDEVTAADVAKRALAIEAKGQTLEKMLFAYCDHLQILGRDSHRDARSIFNLHVVGAFPKIASKPAAHVTPEEIADMMRNLLDADKGRTANKLRSYVRAAYQTAKSAKLNARIPVAFKDFKVSINPAGETMPDSTQNKSGKNPLSQDDLITYWKTIQDVPGVRGAALRAHLLTGGQRIAQLVVLLSTDITDSTITIYDSKGRPGAEPRPHLLPLIPAAKKALADAMAQGHYALSTDGGKTHIHSTTLSKWAQEAVQDVLPGFTAKRVRSGVETLLSKLGFTKDIRGRLQSHGIAGVQDRHYDGHDYLPEKRKALMALHNALEQKKAKVTQIRSSAA